jgi:tRNA U34 5-carboxymethylaminomethyl modifying enzyme MnmG/GidA
MVSINISVDQLIEVISGMDEVEKIQIKDALEYDYTVSEEAKVELLNRKREFLEGKITSKPWAEIKSRYESL